MLSFQNVKATTLREYGQKKEYRQKSFCKNTDKNALPFVRLTVIPLDQTKTVPLKSFCLDEKYLRKTWDFIQYRQSTTSTRALSVWSGALYHTHPSASFATVDLRVVALLKFHTNTNSIIYSINAKLKQLKTFNTPPSNHLGKADVPLGCSFLPSLKI